MKQLLIMAVCFWCVMAFGQSKQKIQFSNISSVGLLSGSSQNKFTIQTINGIKLDKWRIGVGVGIDDYGATSVPVFVDVRRSFGNKTWQPLVYADAGIDYPLYIGDFAEANYYGNQRLYQFNNGFFGEAGIGVSKKISKKASLNVTAGFSYKHLNYLQGNRYQIYPGSLPTPSFTEYNFYYKRLALKVGLQF